MRILFHHYLKSQYTKKFLKLAKQAQATLEDALLKDPNKDELPAQANL